MSRMVSDTIRKRGDCHREQGPGPTFRLGREGLPLLRPQRWRAREGGQGRVGVLSCPALTGNLGLLILSELWVLKIPGSRYPTADLNI